MKRIFSFLLTIGLVFWVSEALGQKATMPAGSKVRYGIELKQLTKQEAQDAVTKGYVDLWVYAWFNQKFVETFTVDNTGNPTSRTFIELNASTGQISRMNFGLVSNSQGYQIVYKDGTNDLRPDNDPSNCVASFSGLDKQGQVEYDEDAESAVGKMVIRDCFGSSSGGSLNGPASSLSGTAAKLLGKVETFEGETWYGRALYKLRFTYNQPESFYVEHRFDDKPANSCGLSTSNFNISLGTDNIYAPFPNGCTGNADWSRTHAANPAGLACEKMPGVFGVIRGGVEVIADPDMQLTAEAACGGSDVTGKLNVNDWAGKDWSNYGSVKFYVNATGGSVSGRKPLTLGSHITTTPSVPTSGSTAPIAYTLTPAGYTLSTGNPADSLIWVIEDTFLA